MATSFNPLGYQIVADFGIPQTLSVKAGGNISGGQLCYIGSKTSTLSSGANSFNTSDLIAIQQASGTNIPVGVATENMASGTDNTTTLLTRGVVVMRTDGAVVAGQVVGDTAGKGCVSVISGATDGYSSLLAAQTVGRALAEAGSNTYCPVLLNI